MLKLILRLLHSVFRIRQALILENVALRHQVEVLQRNSSRPTLRWRDRAFWDILSCLWPDWRKSLYIVQPNTVIRWHRRGFRFYWRWKSRHRWPDRPPSQSWRTFLTNHAKDIVSIDFFTVPTATFRVLYVFLVLDNARRKIIHFNVTTNPAAAWTGQQIVEAFPWDTAPKYMIRDRVASPWVDPFRASSRRTASPIYEESCLVTQHWVVSRDPNGSVCLAPSKDHILRDTDPLHNIRAIRSRYSPDRRAVIVGFGSRTNKKKGELANRVVTALYTGLGIYDLP